MTPDGAARGPRPQRGAGGGGERGAALLAVLWFVAAVASMSITFVGIARGDWAVAAAQVDGVRARALMREGLARTVAAVDAVRAGGGNSRQRPPAAYVWASPDGVVAVRIENETGKVDLNAATPAMLEALARTVGVPEEQAASIAAAVVDWRDKNDLRQANAGGAEDRDYDSADRGYGAADGPFRHVAELRYVLPVDNAAYARLAPHLTVYTGRAEPERRAASPVVRSAMRLRRGIKPADSESGEGGAGDGSGSAGGAGEGGSSAYEGRTSSSSSSSSSFSSGGSGLSTSPPPGGGPTRTPQPGDGAEGPGEGGSGADGGGLAGRGGVLSLLLDVRLAGGYETHARVVVALAAQGGGSGSGGAGGGGRDGPPLRVLDWAQSVPPPPPPAGGRLGP